MTDLSMRVCADTDDLCIMAGRTSSPWSHLSEGNSSRGFMVCSALSLHTKLAESEFAQKIVETNGSSNVVLF